MAKKILVAGATGKQGGALVDALLAANGKSPGSWKIYGLTRDSKSPSAEKLAKKGKGSVELVEGDMESQEFLDSFVNPARDLYAVFSVQSMSPEAGGTKKEIEQGIRLADAAQKANVKHFVYSSVGGAERQTGVPHFDSKFAIEEHIRRIKLPYTILRPVFFMDNLTMQGLGEVAGGFFKYQISRNRKLQMISVRDIGHFAFLALENPAQYLGKEIEIAGDELTFDEANEVWKKHMSGQDIPTITSAATTEMKLMSEEMRTMFDWFDRAGYKADISNLRKVHPELSDFDAFLRKNKEKQ